MKSINRGFFHRLLALIYKEYLQLRRDKSSILIGSVLPIILILIMGYGISLDVKNIPIAVVLEDTSPTARHAVSFLSGSEYFSPHFVTSFKEAEKLMGQRQVDAILTVPPDFSEKLQKRKGNLQLIIYGVNTTTANSVKGYVEAGVQSYNSNFYKGYMAKGLVTVENRIWFNDANSSTWYFVPGLIMLIMTLVGVFLTALVMAREWERGTLEAIFVTPVSVMELLLSKMVPYFGVAMVGFFLCIIASKFLYGIPLHGSFVILLLATILYLSVALGIGLMISSVTKSQFLSCQIAFMVGFLPSLMLSGFLFDLHSVPSWVSAIGHLLPATYYLELLKTLFLAGNEWEMIIKNCTVLFFYGLLFLGIAMHITKKRVE
ncbi:ABC transport system, permease component YbhS [Anaerovibrio sp. JC8]|uniref:ABC transporter permease n=1 Tax=Anaerovibrio sp. JC8 TaxID=1240085 RepID=UPI000A0E0A3C|nr:ABC transporter permease [Anaerovibrio sp. JC8]ORU00639.1 ABC transport system, permease component YbhS [Anaerovibrio sp. JC8]